MKSLFLSFPIIILSIIIFSFIELNFEGKIIYSMDFNNQNIPAEVKAMFEGSELTVYMKGTKTRSEMRMGKQHSTTIVDGHTKTAVTFLEMMGHKYKIIGDYKVHDSAKYKDMTVKYLDETKEIAGYKCKKAEVSFKDKANNPFVTNIYYTEAIPNHNRI